MGIEPTKSRSRDPSPILKTGAGTSQTHTPVAKMIPLSVRRVKQGLCSDRKVAKSEKTLMPMIDHPAGNYRFLPGIAPYSCGVASAPGHEIVHATLHQPIPYRAGFELIEQHLSVSGRPRQSLCGIELRSPK